MTPMPEDHPIILAKKARIQYDLDNAAWLLPLRDAFHAYLLQAGYAPQETPPPGQTYRGSHPQALWECWLAATLAERERASLTKIKETPEAT